MNPLSKHANGCPLLQLAPMEGVGDVAFRKAIRQIGGFDEAVRDFLSVPKNAHVKSLARAYVADEIAPIPLAAQVMGSDPHLMADMALELELRGAPRIDINCGCPSNTVTGRGSGSSLLKEPRVLHEIARSIVNAVDIPVTLKMRIGYEDTTLFQENLFAAQESGVKYITLHARTKTDGYLRPARWEYIAQAKSLLKIPIVGNGDIVSVEGALEMLQQTRCDALMIGRGALINPFIFHQIKAHFAGHLENQRLDLTKYMEFYLASMPLEAGAKMKMNKLKQLLGFLFKRTPELQEKRQQILTSQEKDPLAFLEFVRPFLSS